MKGLHLAASNLGTGFKYKPQDMTARETVNAAYRMYLTL
jgi:hypothetical protein